MAKFSKKPPETRPAAQDDPVMQFIFDGLKEAGAQESSEAAQPTHVPSVDMFSTSATLIIEIEMPGIKKDELEVTVMRNTLTVKAVKFECFDEGKVTYVCMERSFGRLLRQIDLPFPVDTGRIKAVYNNGVLTVTLPKVEDKRGTPRRVAVENK